MTYPRFGAGIWMFGQFVDRYATDAYGPPVGTLDALERASRVDGMEFIDLNYPFSDAALTPHAVRRRLQDLGMKARAVTPAIYTQRFAGGSFTNPDRRVRAEVLDLCREAVDVAQVLGADYVKFWPGQDGYDYPFQVDYGRLWDMSVQGVQSIASAAPDVTFAIEYKLKEPRNHLVFSTAARTLLAIDDMGVDNVGIVLDFGHSLFAKESPTESLDLIHRRGRLVSVELNDNYAEWDDDLAVGSVHLTQTLEFIHALRHLDWDGPWLLDQFPFREDPVRAAHESLRTLRQLYDAAGRIDDTALRAAREEQDALTTQRIALDAMLGGSDGS